MMLKRKSNQARSPWHLLRAGVAGLAVLVGGAAATGGCLDRPVAPAVPRTSNIYVDEIRQTAVDKIDLLFMIDNSISMADKQAILGEAVPLLVQRLITPICVNDCTADTCTEAQKKDGIPTGTNAGSDGSCGGNGKAEFSPINDIHVGVITSSLGSHGATGMRDVCVLPEDDDHAQLLGAIRPGLTTWNNSGFLQWDPGAKKVPPGDADGMTFGDKFTAMVRASGEQGCGYEASLEAWYRFLVDLEPPQSVVVDAATNRSFPMGVDQTILAQRAAFLRPDSLVAIVMLSDENDCSIVDEGYGWLIARQASMYRSTSQCLTNPNDPCCQSCGEGTANAGCPAIASDTSCVTGGSTLKAAGEDDLNLRCWEQKRRFGFELLYPTARYAQGLKSLQIIRRSTGMPEQNPLFAPSLDKPARDPNLVFLAGIIGVPWQDIADDDSLTGAGLRYRTAAELDRDGRWLTILGDPKASPPLAPTDPFMFETPQDRTTVPGLAAANPITGAMLAPPSANSPQANVINGHEQSNVNNRDLQYACTFPLIPPAQCDPAAFAMNKGCDCYEEDITAGFNRPLCQSAAGAYSTTQNYAKAYPGLRHLQVLREFGDNSIVASICPKVLDTNSPDYGYNPAVKAIIDRLKEALKGKCLPRPLVPETADTAAPEEVGQVPCAVVEAVLPSSTGGTCGCDPGQNRIAVDDRPELRAAVLAKLKEGGSCGVDGGTPCESFCTCELAQLSGAQLQECQNAPTPPNTPGYCYINAAPPPEPNVGSAELVKDCPDSSKRLLRFVGGTPAPGAIALVACLGASLGSQ